MLTFTLTNRRFLVKEKVRTTMKQVLYTYCVGPPQRLEKQQQQEPDQPSAAAQPQSYV